MGTDPKIIERIARIYVSKYRAEGFDGAALYADSLIKLDPSLQEDIRLAVERIIKETTHD